VLVSSFFSLPFCLGFTSSLHIPRLTHQLLSESFCRLQ
jgi:hypothetical protein